MANQTEFENFDHKYFLEKKVKVFFGFEKKKKKKLSQFEFFAGKKHTIVCKIEF